MSAYLFDADEKGIQRKYTTTSDLKLVHTCEYYSLFRTHKSELLPLYTTKVQTTEEKGTRTNLIQPK